MTCPAPRLRTKSTCRALQTPVTCAPRCLAICTANVPTPPEAPMTRTCWPGPIPPARRPCNAVTAASGTAAACSKVRFPGLGPRLPWGTAMYSAKAPWPKPYTSSPGLNAVTLLPARSTVPARSPPGTANFGLRTPPSPAGRSRTGSPRMKCQSHGLAELARTRTSTSCAPTTGSSTSAGRRTSPGAPYPCWTIAFMGCPSDVGWKSSAGTRDVVGQRGPLGFELVDPVLHHVADADNAPQLAVHQHRHVPDPVLGHEPHDLFEVGLRRDRAHVGRVDRVDRLGQH